MVTAAVYTRHNIANAVVRCLQIDSAATSIGEKLSSGAPGRIRTYDLNLNRIPRYRCATGEYLIVNFAIIPSDLSSTDQQFQHESPYDN